MHWNKNSGGQGDPTSLCEGEISSGIFEGNDAKAEV